MNLMIYSKTYGSSPVIGTLAGQESGDFTVGVNSQVEGRKSTQETLPSSAGVRGLLTPAPLVDTRLAAEPSAEDSREPTQVIIRASPDESPAAFEAGRDDSASSGYVEPPPLEGMPSEMTAATWRAADKLLAVGVAAHVAHRGVKEVDDPSRLRRTRAVTHGLSCDWEEDLSLEDNSEYVHENVRRYRTPARGSHRHADVFLRLARDLGDNFYWGTYLITASGNRLWTWRLFQLPAGEVVALREKESRHIRKCGRRVAIKPLGVDPDVLRLALELFPVGNIHMRHALSLPEAPKTCAEVLERKAILRECVLSTSGKLPCYHYYKDKLTLVREGIEPNPGPPKPVTAYQKASIEAAAREAAVLTQLQKRYKISKEDRRTLADVFSAARFARGVAAFDPETDEIDNSIWAGHQALMTAMEEDTETLYRYIEAARFTVRGTGMQFPELPRFINRDVDARFWYILMDLVENDCPLTGTAFVRMVGNGAAIFLGTVCKSNLLGVEVVDPRVKRPEDQPKADIDPIKTNLVDQKGSFSDPKIEVADAGRKRDLRRKAWAHSTAVPLGLLDLCRYVLCTERSGPYRLYGIYKGLVETYDRTGAWEVCESDLLKHIEEQERRESRIADRGLAMDFRVDENLYPMYFTVGDDDDFDLREKYGLYKGDVVVSDPHHAFAKKENVYELRAENADDELVLTVRCMTSAEELKFRYPHSWCKIATKRLYGCCLTLEETFRSCQSLVGFTDHTRACPGFANHQDLRVRAFAAALYGMAKAKPHSSLSEAEVLRRISEFRPVAGGTYHEAYTTDLRAVDDKYMELASPCYTVGHHTVDNSFVVIHDPANTKLSPSARLAREGPEAPLPAYARPDPNSLWEQVQGAVKRLSVGRLPLKEEWKTRLEKHVWPQVKAYIEGKADSLDVLTPDEIYDGCREHAELKGFKGIELQQYLGGAALFLRGANGEDNLLDEAWRTEYGCFTKSENYALSGKKPTRSIQCPDLFVRGYQHAMLATAQHNLFVNIFPHLTIKHLNEDQKMEKIRSTFAHAQRVVCTDLTAMEKNVNSYMMTFEREVFKACSPVWMHPAIDQAWDELMTLPRAISHKMFDLFVDPMRASGEDHTSAGNFVCNLMWICAWTDDAAAILDGTRPCLVEGDDGQVGVDGLQLPDAKQIAGLGIRIKLEESVADSSFVSKTIKNDRPVCDALSIAQNFSVIRDPDLASNHGDAAKQYAMAMSYYYLYGGYPIIGPYFLGYLLRHHDAVMGTQTGILAVKKAFCAKYVGWVEPSHIEAMWQDVLRGQASPRPAVKTTESDLAEVCGVSVRTLQEIYSCRPTEYGNSVPSGARFTVDDQVKAAVHAAHVAAKKIPPCRIDEAPSVIVDTWGWWWTFLFGWMFTIANGTRWRPSHRHVMTVRGRMGRELRQHMFVPTVERKLSFRKLLKGMIILGIGTAVLTGASTVAYHRGPELQARYGSLVDATMAKYQFVSNYTSGLWSSAVDRLRDPIGDYRRWRQAIARDRREAEDVESLSFHIDKPLVVYVSPKEQWRSFMEGPNRYYLQYKLAQVLVIVPWFALFAALAIKNGVVAQTTSKIRGLANDRDARATLQDLLDQLERDPAYEDHFDDLFVDADAL